MSDRRPVDTNDDDPPPSDRGETPHQTVEETTDAVQPPSERTGRVSSRQLRAVLVGLAAGVGGFIALVIWQFALLFGFIAATGASVEELTMAQELVISTLSLGVGMATGAAAYLHWSDRSFSFIDLKRLRLRDVGYTVGGLVALFVAVIAISLVTEYLGVSASEHGIVESVEEGDADVLLLLVPLSILVIGPGEELLFRNVVQKHLYDTFTRRAAILVASVIFAIVHVPAYATGAQDPLAIATSIVVIFVLSLLLGWIYHRTENIIVPSLVHGCYNAILFGSLYVELGGAL